MPPAGWPPEPVGWRVHVIGSADCGADTSAGLTLVALRNPLLCRLVNRSASSLFRLPGNSVVVVRSDRGHDLLLPSQAHGITCAYIDGAAVPTALKEQMDNEQSDFALTERKGCFQIFESMLHLLQSEKDKDSLVFQSLTNTVIHYIVNNSRPIDQRNAPGERVFLTKYSLSKINRYISENIDRKINISEIADLIPLSVYHFSRVIKHQTGMSPHQYITEKRIEMAKSMLKDNQKPLTDVALECGFSNQSHFTTAFKNATQITPGLYRRIARMTTILDANEENSSAKIATHRNGDVIFT